MGCVNEDELAWDRLERGETCFERKQLGAAAGSERLGCSLYELPPGKRSWPYHYHTANEEAIYVLAGRGTVRLTDEERSIREGDYVALPADERGGHRLVNDGEETLRYLAVSTMDEPDVTIYPDSGKFGVFVDAPPGGRGERALHGYYRLDDGISYWAGEEDEGEEGDNGD